MQCLLTPGRAFQAGTSRFVKWQWWLQTMTIKSMITASSIRTWHCGSFLQEHVKLFLSPSEKVPLKTAPIPLQKNGNNHPRYVERPFSQESSVSDPLCVHHLYSRSDCSSLALLKEIQHWTGPGSPNPTGSSGKLRRLWSWATLALSQLHTVSPCLRQSVALSSSEAQQIFCICSYVCFLLSSWTVKWHLACELWMKAPFPFFALSGLNIQQTSPAALEDINNPFAVRRQTWPSLDLWFSRKNCVIPQWEDLCVGVAEAGQSQTVSN